MFAMTMMNETARLSRAFEPGDALVVAPTINVRDNDDAIAMLEDVWMIGNRMATDEHGQAWPSNVRSMSVGDVVVLEDGRAFTVDMIGWNQIGLFDAIRGTARGERADAVALMGVR